MPTYTWDGPKNGEDEIDLSLVRNLTEQYTLITDDASMDQFGASARFSTDKSIVIKTAHSTCTYAYCSKITSKFHQGSSAPNRKFDITVSYTTAPDSGGTGSASVSGPAAPQVASQQQGVAPSSRVDAPLSRGWDLITSGGTRRVARYSDTLNQPFKNSMGDPLFPPMMCDVPTVKYRLSINRSTRASTHLAYQGKVNSVSVTLPGTTEVWAAKTLKFLTLEITPVYENNTGYFRHDYHFESGPYWTWNFDTYLGWVFEVPNVGKRKLETIGGVDKRVPIYDASNMPVSDPQYLDLDGQPLPEGFAASDIKWLTFYPDLTFAMAGLWT
jgi:hypothetical protein